jgi:hypothetical protein
MFPASGARAALVMASVGEQVMASFVERYGKINAQSGFRQFTGEAINGLLSRVLQGGIKSQDTITAFAGGGKASGVQLRYTFNRISVCATNNDSVVLPKAIKGSEVTVINAGAATLAVFSQGNDTTGANNAATADTIATTKAKKYTCVTAGHWDVTSAT